MEAGRREQLEVFGEKTYNSEWPEKRALRVLEGGCQRAVQVTFPKGLSGGHRRKALGCAHEAPWGGLGFRLFP